MRTKLLMMGIGVVMTAVGAERGSAVTASWTGAADNYWTNAANWAAGVVPGLCSNQVDGVWVVDGSRLDSAVFDGANFADASTPVTIDLSGLTTVKNVTVQGATTPVVTFGTSDSQKLYLTRDTAYNTAGRFSVAAGVVNMPVIKAALGFGGMAEKSQDGSTVENNASGRLVINKIAPRLVAPGGSGGTLRMYFMGTGDIEIAGDTSKITGEMRFQNDMSGGRLCFTTNFNCRVTGQDVSYAGVREYNLAEGATFSVSASGLNGVELRNSDTLFSGAGLLSLSGNTVEYGDGCTYQVGSSRTSEISCPIKAAISKHSSLRFDGSSKADTPGTVKLRTSDNRSEGDVVAQNMLILDIDVAARLGAATRNVVLSNYGRLRYSGTGEEIAKNIVITNGLCYLEQAGTGPVSFTGTVTASPSPTVELVLANDTSEAATLTSALADPVSGGTALKLTKTGSGVWTVSGALAHTGDTRVQAGTLRFAGAAVPPAAVTMGSASGVAFAGGANAPAAVALGLSLPASSASRLVVEEGCTQSFTVTVTQGAGATLAVTAPVEANIVFAGMGLASDASWITWNGETCSFNASGKLVKGYFARVDAFIPVKGGVVTNGAGRVGIVDGGAEGPITLSETTVAVDALAQKAAAEAVVALNGGTLKTGELDVDTGAGALMIGAAAGDGMLKANAGALAINVASTNAPIEVKSAVDFSDATSVTKGGAGTLRFSGAFDYAGTFNNNMGVVATTNLPAFYMKGTGTFVKEGDATWEPTRAWSEFNGDYAISNGTVRPRNGMTLFGQRVGKLTVGEGATLAINLEKIYNDGSGVGNASSVYFGGRTVHFAGRGVDGKGALQVEWSSRNGDMTCLFNNLALDGDAYFNYPEETSQRFSVHDSGGAKVSFDMNGHTLVKGGVGKMSVFDVYVTNAGPIVMESTMPTNKSGWRNEFLLFYSNDLGANAPFELQTNAVLTLNNSRVPQRRPITVKGPVLMRNIADQLTGWGDDLNRWLGDITFDASTPANALAVNAGSNDPYARIALEGNIAGPGEVTVGSNAGLSGSKGGRVDFGGTNTFTGKLTVNGGDNAFLVVKHPEGVPSAANTEVKTGRLSAMLSETDDDGLWPWSSILSLANNVAFTDGGTVAAFVREGVTASVALNDADVTRADSADFGLGKDGRGTLAVSGEVTNPIRMAVYDGTLKVTGSVTVSNLLVTSDRAWGEGCLEVANGGEVKIAAQTGEIIFAPHGESSVRRTRGRARIAGKITQLGLDSNGLISGTRKGLTIGGVTRASTNIVEIVDGADIEARMSIAYSTEKHSSTADAQPVSAVYQTGGRVHNLGHPTSGGDECPYLGGSGAAYYNLAGGEYRSSGYFRWGCYTTFQSSFDSLVLEQTGGCFHSDSGGKSIAGTSINVGNDHSAFLIYHAGGTACYSNVFYLGFGSNANGALVVSGPDAFCRIMNGFVGNQYANRVALVIRDGAVFEAPSMRLVTGSLANRRYTVAFDGGTWRSDQTGDILLNSESKVPSLVTVYAGGAVFEAMDDSRTMTVGAPLVAPQGQGITSIPLPERFRKVAAPPAVAVTGEAENEGGAVFRCVYDKTLGEVTGIETIVPGHSYSKAPTVTVRLGADSQTVEPVMGSVAAGGGVTVKGPGTVALACTNTYAGTTVVKSGTLKCLCDYAVPSNGAVRVEGGVLDLNGKKAEFSALTCAGGTLTGAENLAFTGDWTIDVAAAYAGSVFTVPAGTALPAAVTLANYASVPADAKSFTILSAPGSTATAVPAYEAGDLPPAWQLYWLGSELKLGVPRATRIIFR